RSNIEVQKNKIQLFCSQVYVTDSVEGIVPDFLTLLHGVIDSPDIPLNVSRSFLQNDSNVKKLSSHITKKVADKLTEIFNNDRAELEKKWDDLKLFIEYGMITDEKFYEKAEKFFLLKNTDIKYFTFDEYRKIIKENQTDKYKNVVFLYATNKDYQYSYIAEAKSKGYDVVLLDGYFDIHFINHIEPKMDKTTFKRVDADIVEKLIEKDEVAKSSFTAEQESDLRHIFLGYLPKEKYYGVIFEGMKEDDLPMVITQSEFMRRMKDMSLLGSQPMMGFRGDLPESFNLIVNSNHRLIKQVLEAVQKDTGEKVKEIREQLAPLIVERDSMRKAQEGKKDEEISTADKDKLTDIEKAIDKHTEEKKNYLNEYGKQNNIVKQLIDIALLANNMLKGEDLSMFVKRSVHFIQ
ncbi:MAG: molecular chaperone HtpG, partial [Bacteroidia bacterium]|nr:molecular chaperone HtpG [Bacteroidia bacterium]